MNTLVETFDSMAQRAADLEPPRQYLWEILVPTIRPDGKPYTTRFHRTWDERVRKITGGLTVLQPVKGQWVSQAGGLFMERMIPVRIACTEAQIEQIADLVAKQYEQLAVMWYRVSDKVRIKHYKGS